MSVTPHVLKLAQSDTVLGGSTGPAPDAPKKAARKRNSRRKQKGEPPMQCITLGSPQHLRVSGSYTVEMWVKMDTEEPAAKTTKNLRKMKRSGNSTQILFMQGQNLALFLYGGTLQARLPGANSSSAFSMQTSVDASMLTSWTHVAVVGDGSGSTLCVPPWAPWWWVAVCTSHVLSLLFGAGTSTARLFNRAKVQR